MPQIAYTVTATLPTTELANEYVRWLAEGHIQQVCQHGAISAHVILIDTQPGEPPSAQTRYIFPDRQTLAQYLQSHAPRLRAEGLARFGPDKGVSFSRSTGLLTFACVDR